MEPFITFPSFIISNIWISVYTDHDQEALDKGQEMFGTDDLWTYSTCYMLFAKDASVDR